MVIQSEHNLWHYTGACVRGASHVRHGLPNQDFYACVADVSPTRPPLIMAVADGHGSAKSFRSDRGSRFAGQVVVNTLKAFFDRLEEPANFSLIKRSAEEHLPPDMVRQWEKAVLDDLAADPLPPETDAPNPLLVYGATLLAVLVTDTFICYWQLGDGDIVTVWDNGQIERPLPKDERLFANETTSLCQKEAWRNFRFRFQPITEQAPRLILLTTDGYPNSFRDDAGFLQAAGDIQAMIRNDDFGMIAENLETWLNEASELGSGDDVTVGVLYRITVG